VARKPIPTSNEEISLHHRIRLLLTPSWFSGLVAIVAALAVVAGTVFALRYNGSDVQLLQQLQANKPHQVTQDYRTLDQHITANTIISDIPLFIFWAGVGILTYSLTINLIRTFGKAAEFRQELDYVHVDRQTLLKETAWRFGARAAALGVWLLYISYSTHVIVPFVTALAYAGSGNLPLLSDVGYLAGAIGLLALAVHVHIILLRLLLLKPRVLSRA
jgi:hypothetical protein